MQQLVALQNQTNILVRQFFCRAESTSRTHWLFCVCQLGGIKYKSNQTFSSQNNITKLNDTVGGIMKPKHKFRKNFFVFGKNQFVKSTSYFVFINLLK